jgi:hypothetical protein
MWRRSFLWLIAIFVQGSGHAGGLNGTELVRLCISDSTSAAYLILGASGGILAVQTIDAIAPPQKKPAAGARVAVPNVGGERGRE